jgi:hypothetical protein
MRITEHEKNVIVEAAKSADPDAKVWFFGSRTDDTKKGTKRKSFVYPSFEDRD